MKTHSCVLGWCLFGVGAEHGARDIVKRLAPVQGPTAKTVDDHRHPGGGSPWVTALHSWGKAGGRWPLTSSEWGAHSSGLS